MLLPRINVVSAVLALHRLQILEPRTRLQEHTLKNRFKLCPSCHPAQIIKHPSRIFPLAVPLRLPHFSPEMLPLNPSFPSDPEQVC